jgi:hypothetical protein
VTPQIHLLKMPLSGEYVPVFSTGGSISTFSLELLASQVDNRTSGNQVNNDESMADGERNDQVGRTVPVG